MRLAPDDIAITVGNLPTVLRPSLRAATRLARRHGFAELLAAIAHGNITIIADIVGEGECAPTSLPRLIEEIGLKGLGATLNDIAGPLTQFVFALAAIDPDAPQTGEPTGKPMPLADYHKRLFQIATGWLGWTPDTAWNAAPAEIEAAFEGHLEKLKAIHGSADEEKPKPLTYTSDALKEVRKQGFDPAFDRPGLHALKSRGGA